jgi:hypothetical protein
VCRTKGFTIFGSFSYFEEVTNHGPMPRFFNRIRKQLAKDNKFFLYSRYAIGEILLVVIGILIALQIDNWNEERKERSVEMKALLDLKREFNSNRILLESSVNHKKDAYSSNEEFLKVIHSGVATTKSIVRDYGGSTINPNNGVLNSLIATGRINTIRNDSLKHLLTSWSDLIQNYREEEERHYNWLDLVVWPYLNEVVPNNDYSKQGGWYFLDTVAVLNRYNKAFKNMKFRNFHIENRKALSFVLRESQPVLKSLDQILTLIDSEIRKHN